MFKLKAWYKDKGCPVRYIISNDDITELWAMFNADIDIEDVIEVHIGREI